MNKVIISTKGENTAYKIAFILGGLFFMAMGVWVFMMYESVSVYNKDMRTLGLMISVLAFSPGIVSWIFCFSRCKSYIEISTDHVEGRGLQGRGIKEFYLRLDQIRSVSRESYYMCLHTDIGEIKIICNKNAYEQVSRFFLSRERRYVSAAPTVPGYGAVPTARYAYGATVPARPGYGAAPTARYAYGATVPATPGYGAVPTARHTYGATAPIVPGYGAAPTARTTSGSSSGWRSGGDL